MSSPATTSAPDDRTDAAGARGRSSSVVLPRSAPEAQGLSSAAISGFLDGVAADRSIELHSLMILRHGTVVAEGWWAPYRRDDVHLLYSLSKSFTSTAAGFARAEGLIDFDRPAWEYLPGVGQVEDRRLRRLTVRDAIRMATGHRTDTLDRVGAMMHSAEPLRGFFDNPPEEEPGSIFCYNNGATYLVAAIVQQVSGQTLTQYLQPRLFDPLGIDLPFWQSAPAGRNIGFSGLHLATESIAKFGQLYLDRGVWQGRQLLPAGWVEEATAAHTANPAEPEPDWRQGYGYQFWRSRHDGYRGDGAFGQFCVILPELDAVVVTTAATEQMQRLLDLVWHRLLPGFGETELADDHGQAARLADRLAGLALPPVAADPGVVARDLQWTVDSGPAAPDMPAVLAVLDHADDHGGDDHDGDDHDGDDHDAADHDAADHDVADHDVADHDGVLVIGEAGSAPEDGIRIPYRAGGWVRSELSVGGGRLVVEATGAWTSPEEFAAEVTFVNTPHRLLIDIAGGAEPTRTVRWGCAPLGSNRLASLALG